MNQKVFWLSLILLVAVGVSTGLMLLGSPQHRLIHKKKKTMDAFMVNVIYVQYNEQGLVHSRLVSSTMDHYAENNTAYFTDPKILIYTQHRIPWHISALYGKSRHGTQWVYLWNKVKLHQPQLPQHPETTITTSALTVYPSTSRATTKRAVTITRPGSVIKGIGVKADFKTGIMQLLSHSRGYYESKKLAYKSST